MKTRTGYLIKRNRIFHACWTVNGKKVMKSTGTSNRKEAKAKLDEIMSPFRLVDDVRTLEHIAGEIQGRRSEIARLEEKRNPPLPISGAWRAYTASTNRPDSGPATLEQYGFQFDAFTRWLATEHPTVTLVQDVTKEIAQAYASHLQARGVSAGTFTKHMRLLHLVFAVLATKTRITTNPWARENITRKKAIPQSRRELTIDELRKICESATGEFRSLLALGLYTGMRLGDCCTLRWPEVDLTLGVVRRLPNKTARRGATVMIPLHATLRTILDETPKTKRREYVLPELATLYLSGRRYVVTDRIQSHFIACGIATQKPGTGQHKDTTGKFVKTGKRAVVDVGFHSLRHTFVSLCRAANAPLSVVEAIVGHSNPAMTRHYTHTSEAAASAAVASLPDITGQAVAKPALPAGDETLVTKAKIRELAEQLTPANAKTIRDQLLELAGAN